MIVWEFREIGRGCRVVFTRVQIHRRIPRGVSDISGTVTSQYCARIDAMADKNSPVIGELVWNKGTVNNCAYELWSFLCVIRCVLLSYRLCKSLSSSYVFVSTDSFEACEKGIPKVYLCYYF